MKQALISKIEPRETGYRVAQVVPVNETFPVAVDFFWVTCADDVVQDKYWYDPADETIKQFPGSKLASLAASLLSAANT
jgi:hypothetical protein